MAFDDWLLRFGHRPRVLARATLLTLVTGVLGIFFRFGIQPDFEHLVPRATASAQSDRDAHMVQFEVAEKDRVITGLAAAFGALGRARETGSLDPAEVERALLAAAKGDRRAARAMRGKLAGRATKAAPEAGAGEPERREAAER